MGHEALEIDPTRLRFARPGMGATLNGIRQGYNTDRVVELLRAGGVEYALVDRGSADILPAVPSSLSDLRSARPITY